MIEFRNIIKTFAGVVALSDVSLSVARGECHALIGENGAGKSTLGKILSGIHRPDSGEILLDEKPYAPTSPAEALRARVAMVHQELAFCPDLSVAENLCMGQYPRRLGLFLAHDQMHRRARELLARIGVAALDVRRSMRTLSTAQEQLVQIAAAIGIDARVIIFDEPTSSLSDRESQQLFALIDQLRAQGVTIIYVSHRMLEIFRLCDRISVLRDGRLIATLPRAQTSPDEVVRLMIGRNVGEYFPRHLSQKRGEIVLEVKNLASPRKFRNVTFAIRAGEIVGFAGLVGAGRSEVARAIFGLDRAATGDIRIEGKSLDLGSLRHAKQLGIGLVPEDRKRQGLVLQMSGRANFSMAMLERYAQLGMLQQRREARDARASFTQLRVKMPSIETPVLALSGGNQQKIALAKWLARGARLLIVDEPTRGVDVGAKAAIHELIDDLARSGVAVMLISSELPEVLNLSTRIIVMREGAVVAELSREDSTQEKVLRMMAGVATSVDH